VTNWSHAHDADTLNEALQYTEQFRKLGMIFVTMVSENPNSVGKLGVDSVVDGRTPDGVAYTWNKASRIGRTKKK
jgi:microsomal dipeptidase-like Zn-dependent dipeptidase